MKNVAKLILCIGLVFSFNIFADEAPASTTCPASCKACAQQCQSGTPNDECKDACTTCKDNTACPKQ